MNDALRAANIACVHCAGSFRVNLAAGDTTCPYCGALNRLDAAARQRVLDYESNARMLLGQEALARRMAAMHQNAARNNARVIASTIFLGLFVAWWIIAGASGLASRLHPAVTGVLVLLSLVTEFALFGSMAAMVRAPSEVDLLAVDMGQCGECAAFVPFRRGAAQARCQYCHSFAIKPSSLLAQSLAGAQQVVTEEQARHEAAADDNQRTATEARFLGVRMRVGGWVALSIVAAFGMVFAVVALMAKTDSGAAYPTWWVWTTLSLGLITSVAWVVQSVRNTIAANRAFEARYGVSLVASPQPRAGSPRG